MTTNPKLPDRIQIEDIVRLKLGNICSIYPTIGKSFYDEPRDRLVQGVATDILELYGKIL